MNWDGVFKINDHWYFVEAKAHIAEAESECRATSAVSREIIERAFFLTTNSETIAGNWINSKYYQLANRLAFIHFCKSVNIKASLCYISFVNGYVINDKKNVTDSADWEKCWEKIYKDLQISDELKKDIIHICIDCKEPK